jgi:hypothetical protein
MPSSERLVVRPTIPSMLIHFPSHSLILSYR